MKTQKISSCCGQYAVRITLDKPLQKDIVATLINLGFEQAPHFQRAGVLYMSNDHIIISGVFGGNNITLKAISIKDEEYLQKTIKTLGG